MIRILVPMLVCIVITSTCCAAPSEQPAIQQTTGLSEITVDITQPVNLPTADVTGLSKNTVDITRSVDDGTIQAKAAKKVKTYTVKFRGNGATSGKTESKKMKRGVSTKLPKNRYKKKGYTFICWNTKKDGTGKSYANKQAVKNIAAAGKSITLYAMWVRKNPDYAGKVVWIGDSLTQGSRGDDNGNVNNPHAPWRVLASMCKTPVEGYGYYGLNTHDILWKYGYEGGIKEPAWCYIFWVGSNDFRDSPDSVGMVEQEIDNFLEAGGIGRYLVLGTTSRVEIRDNNKYIEINNDMAQHYGEHYLDIMPYVEFGKDDLHLTKKSYKEVAKAVFVKLNKMGQIEPDYLGK